MPRIKAPVVQPPSLRRGDAVAITAPSSALRDDDSLKRGIAVLESWGLKVQPHQLDARHWGYLSGTDQQRRADLDQRPTPPLLACARGGWGAARLLEQSWPWSAGWLLGFSDITALLCSRLAQGVGGGVHGPLVTTLADEPDWSQQRLQELLFDRMAPDLNGETWVGGKAQGPLLTANLTVASHLLGSSHLPDMRGMILVIEDVGEAPYRLDRMLTHWRLAGSLQGLAGLGLGRFSGCEDPNLSASAEETFSLEQVLKERTVDLGIPVISGLPVGHGPGGNAALPVGVPACLDANRGILSLDLPDQR